MAYLDQDVENTGHFLILEDRKVFLSWVELKYLQHLAEEANMDYEEYCSKFLFTAGEVE